jgi:hypothetical protein
MAGGAWALTEPVKSQHKAYLLAHNKTLNLLLLLAESGADLLCRSGVENNISIRVPKTT